MDIDVPPGVYVVAVSGGIDSCVLLDLLAKKPGLDLIVAHFDHGIRTDSAVDANFVRDLAKKYGLKFELGDGNLGATASEEKARIARYKFLNSVLGKYSAKAIVSAHHQDDELETAFINIIRGTGPRGLSAIKKNPAVMRPLLAFSKKQIYKYAQKNNIAWKEDPTNKDTGYLRNYIRLNILPSLSADQKNEMIKNIDKVAKINQEQDSIIANLSQSIEENKQIKRNLFVMLPTEISNQLVIYWLRKRKVFGYDTQMVNRLTTQIKTAKPNSRHNVIGNVWLSVDNEHAWFWSKQPEVLI